TVGRIAFAAIERRFPEADTYRLLPFVAALAALAGAALPAGARAGGGAACGGRRRGGGRGVRPGRAGLLGPAAVDDQLRPARAGGHGRIGRRDADRDVPAGLPAESVRGRPAGRLREERC